jgi:hypothetical protein
LPGIWRIPSKGGEPEIVRTYDVATKGVEFPLVTGFWGDSLLYTSRRGPGSAAQLHRLDSNGKSTLLRESVAGGLRAGEFLVYGQAGGLSGERLDAQWQPVPGGSPRQLAPQVATRIWTGPVAAANAQGMLAFLHPADLPARHAVWTDRSTGRAEDVGLAPAAFEQLRVSPVDPKRIAVTVQARAELWKTYLMDLSNGAVQDVAESRIRLPRAIWSPDGKSLAVSSAKDNGAFVNLYLWTSGNQAAMRRLTEQPLYGHYASSWSAARQEIVFLEGTHPDTYSDLKTYSLRTGEVRTVVATQGADLDADFSPDGRWLTYASNERNGEMAMYIRPTDRGAKQPARWLFPGRGGIWADAGSKLVFCQGTQIFEVSMREGLPVGSPRKIANTGCLALDVWTRPLDLAPDGRVLGMIGATPGPGQAVIEVIRDVGAER